MTKKSHAAEISGAQRASIGTKTDTTLVPYELVLAAAAGLNYGAVKYDERNYEKGLSYRSLCMSIERHNRAILDNEPLDEDSGLPHYVLLASSVAMLCHNVMQGVVIDNRPPPKQGRSIAEMAKVRPGGPA